MDLLSREIRNSIMMIESNGGTTLLKIPITSRIDAIFLSSMEKAVMFLNLPGPVDLFVSISKRSLKNLPAVTKFKIKIQFLVLLLELVIHTPKLRVCVFMKIISPPVDLFISGVQV